MHANTPFRRERWFVPAVALAGAPAALAGEVPSLQFADETQARLVAPAALGASDTARKRYAWGDVDLDGDVDLFVVRIAAMNGSLGPLRNVLFMNEDGLLADRTDAYAAASSQDGDQGFLTATSDTHALLVDLNGDGWLDLITATASLDGPPPSITHPRVYVNLGAPDGDWLGLRHEPQRIPQMHPTAGPRFTDVAAGDLTGDGLPDLYFCDDDIGAESFDYSDRLLINDGGGFFTDQTALRLPPVFFASSFGGDAVIGDMNGDRALDIVRLTTYSGGELEIAYNDPEIPGAFEVHDAGIPLGYSPYSLSADDLNGDGSLDLVVLENDIAPYVLNTGVDASGHALLETHYFGNNFLYGRSVLADVDHDGAPDCLKANMYSNGSWACYLPMELHHNTGIEDDLLVAQSLGVPADVLRGTEDIAVFDIDGDGWRDLVLAQCDGNAVLINQRPDCPADLTGDAAVGVQDLVLLIESWGATGSPADIDGDGVVAVGDLIALLLSWGPCA